MIEVRRIIRICDEHFWFTKIWHDNSNVNGNKLRLYRNFKKDLVPEHYVLNYVPRHLRSLKWSRFFFFFFFYAVFCTVLNGPD